MIDASPDRDSAIVRIQRDIADAAQSLAERRMLREEASKLVRERWLEPVIANGCIAVGVLAVAIGLAGIIMD